MATLEQDWETAAPDLTADWESAVPAERPSTLAVAGQSVAKGLASIPDAVLNAPTNVLNLGKAAVGFAAGELGRPDITANMELSEPPSPVRSALEQPVLTVGGKEVVGPIIRPGREPQTGLQRVIDRSIQAGTQAAVMPGRTLGELIKNAATLALSGFTGGVAKEATGDERIAFLTQLATPMVARGMTGSTANKPTLKNPVKTETIQDAQKAGYVIPPSQVKPSATTNRLESVAGKAAVKQEAAIRNQDVTNKLAAKAIGLADDQPLTPDAIKAVRTDANKVYQKVADVSPRAKSALTRLQEERSTASDNWMAWFRNARPEDKLAAVAADGKVKQLEQVIAKEAGKAGQPGLINELRKARTLIAKTHDVEEAMNVGSGNISAAYIGRALDRGRPLTGELKVIGKFQQAFPDITREGVTSAGVGFFEPALAIGAGAAGYAASGGEPAGLALGLLPLARGGARSALLSSPYQQRLLQEPISLTQAFQQSALAGKSAADVQGAP